MPVGPQKYTDEQLALAVATSPNMRQALIALGLSPRGGNYETVRRRITALGLDASHLERWKRVRIAARSDQEVLDAVKSSRSYAETLKKLGMMPEASRFALKRRVQMLAIDTSHFLGMAWRKGSRLPVVPAYPLEKILVIGRFTPTNKLKQRLIDAGVKERRCEICGLETWNGKPIPLELDHVNGRRDDNRLSNLRLLCPNCHAQTPTYRGRNIGVSERLS
jgi:HNH endonuclease